MMCGKYLNYKHLGFMPYTLYHSRHFHAMADSKTVAIPPEAALIGNSNISRYHGCVNRGRTTEG